MAKGHYNLFTRISVGLMMASAATRFLLGLFQNNWLKKHLTGGARDIIYVSQEGGGDKSVYVTYSDVEGFVVTENCTELFLKLTWLDISRKVMAVISCLSMLISAVLTILEILADD